MIWTIVSLSFETNKKMQCAGPVTAKCYRLERIHHHHLGPVWTGAWWDTRYSSVTHTRLFTLLALKVKRNKYFKMGESEQKWLSKRAGEDFLPLAVGGQRVFYRGYFFFFLPMVLSVCLTMSDLHRWWITFPGKLFGAGCGCGPQGKEKEKPLHRHPQGLWIQESFHLFLQSIPGCCTRSTRAILCFSSRSSWSGRPHRCSFIKINRSQL